MPAFTRNLDNIWKSVVTNSAHQKEMKHDHQTHIYFWLLLALEEQEVLLYTWVWVNLVDGQLYSSLIAIREFLQLSLAISAPHTAEQHNQKQCCHLAHSWQCNALKAGSLTDWLAVFEELEVQSRSRRKQKKQRKTGLADPLRINTFGISEPLRKTGKGLCNRKHRAYPSLCLFL